MISHLASYSAPGVDDEVNHLSFFWSWFCQFSKISISWLFSFFFDVNFLHVKCHVVTLQFDDKNKVFPAFRILKIVRPARLKLTDFNNHWNGIAAKTILKLNCCSKCKLKIGLLRLFCNDSSVLSRIIDQGFIKSKSKYLPWTFKKL